MTERGVKASLPRTFRALAHRNFRLFFTGQGLSLIGTWLQQVAMGWLTYRLTNSAWLLGVVAFCANVGILLFSNVAGVLADRIDRRRGLLVTQSLMLTQAIVLAVLVAFGWIQTWHLVVLALWLGTCAAFDTPLRQSMYVHFIADRGDLANAIALNSMLVTRRASWGPRSRGCCWLSRAKPRALRSTRCPSSPSSSPSRRWTGRRTSGPH